MKTRRLAASAFASLLLVTLAFAGVGEALSRAATSPVGAAPADLQATSVAIPTPSGGHVSGWFVPGESRAGAMLLLHGVRGDRRQMIERARLLGRQGYAVLLIDLPAHGESSGDRITFGLRESQGVTAALAYLRQRLPGERIGVMGVSLGAASVVLAKASPAPDAVVLESMFPTLAEAVADRLVRQLGPAGRHLAPPLLWQLPLRFGIDADQIRPIADLPALHAPVLIASGTADLHTTLAESRRLYEAAREPKQFWPVEGAAHVDLYQHGPLAYERVVLPFLAKHLRDGA